MPRNANFISNWGVEMMTYRRLCELMSPADVDIVLSFLRSTDSVTSLVANRPISDKAFMDTVKTCLKTHADDLYTNFVLNHQDTAPSDDEAAILAKLFGQPVPFWCVDSAPFKACAKIPGTAYNGHYKESIVKFLFIVNLRGFFVAIDGPFGGTKFDNHLLFSSPLGALIAQKQFKCLGDLHFRGVNIVNQYTVTNLKTHIVTGTDTFVAANNAVLFNKLSFNERVGFVRARIEQCFGNSVLGRFGRLTNGSIVDDELLRSAVMFACAVCNLEALLKHGDHGRITRIDTAWMNMMVRSTNKLSYQRSRYPDLFSVGPSSTGKRKRGKSKPGTATNGMSTVGTLRIATKLKHCGSSPAMKAAIAAMNDRHHQSLATGALEKETNAAILERVVDSDAERIIDEEPDADSVPEEVTIKNDEVDGVQPRAARPQLSLAEVKKFFPPNTLAPRQRKKKRE